ncbi:hypothetical protein CEUSTIGMA_g11607.t1 [Chlamydomonas eustigma]|uniref:C3H1-type domain-containing protein n=1 Tax=Chlamydomonas eustigma TaxID=1157962 RepID=A0A250XM74_9CHLO|nr:hypothetical protein CEUSTIGMA_g11607.t1 [Chlamydomonas eustigma]|eukprot:GAX84184.1 hypothetical protein CEUSTIGMA_g11607.t1 [Chlamydomonas eustigma]
MNRFKWTKEDADNLDFLESCSKSDKFEVKGVTLTNTTTAQQKPSLRNICSQSVIPLHQVTTDSHAKASMQAPWHKRWVNPRQQAAQKFNSSHTLHTPGDQSVSGRLSPGNQALTQTRLPAPQLSFNSLHPTKSSNASLKNRPISSRNEPPTIFAAFASRSNPESKQAPIILQRPEPGTLGQQSSKQQRKRVWLAADHSTKAGGPFAGGSVSVGTVVGSGITGSSPTGAGTGTSYVGVGAAVAAVGAGTGTSSGAGAGAGTSYVGAEAATATRGTLTPSKTLSNTASLKRFSRQVSAAAGVNITMTSSPGSSAIPSEVRTLERSPARQFAGLCVSPADYTIQQSRQQTEPAAAAAASKTQATASPAAQLYIKKRPYKLVRPGFKSPRLHVLHSPRTTALSRKPAVVLDHNAGSRRGGRNRSLTWRASKQETLLSRALGKNTGSTMEQAVTTAVIGPGIVQPSAAVIGCLSFDSAAARGDNGIPTAPPLTAGRKGYQVLYQRVGNRLVRSGLKPLRKGRNITLIRGSQMTHTENKEQSDDMASGKLLSTLQAPRMGARSMHLNFQSTFSGLPASKVSDAVPLVSVDACITRRSPLDVVKCNSRASTVAATLVAAARARAAAVYRRSFSPNLFSRSTVWRRQMTPPSATSTLQATGRRRHGSLHTTPPLHRIMKQIVKNNKWSLQSMAVVFPAGTNKLSAADRHVNLNTKMLKEHHRRWVKHPASNKRQRYRMQHQQHDCHQLVRMGSRMYRVLGRGAGSSSTGGRGARNLQAVSSKGPYSSLHTWSLSAASSPRLLSRAAGIRRLSVAALARTRALAAARSAGAAPSPRPAAAAGSRLWYRHPALSGRPVVRRDEKKAARALGHCLTYCRTGSCEKWVAGLCERVHDSSKVNVCSSWLQGSCEMKAGSQCKLQHKVVKDLMPVCSFYLEGLCSKDDCPYLHINYSPDTLICRPFLNGYCPRGAECPRQHLTRRMVKSSHDGRTKVIKDGASEDNKGKEGGLLGGKQVLKRMITKASTSHYIAGGDKWVAGRVAKRVRTMGLGLAAAVQLKPA